MPRFPFRASSRPRPSFFPVLFLAVLPAAVLAGARPAGAAVGAWTPIGPDGGQVTALAVAPSEPDTVYAGAYRSGLYKSPDGGSHWSLLGHGIGAEAIGALAVDPTDPGTVYAAGESGAVFKTVDGGGNWARVWAGAPPPTGLFVPTFSLVIDPRRPRTVFAGTRDGLYRSTDGGATWALRGRKLLGSFRSLAYDGAGGWLYAGVDGQGVFRSADQGSTWTPASAGLPPNRFYAALALDPDRPKTVLVTTPVGLYRSLDRGGHWQIAAGTPQRDTLAVAFQRHGRVYAAFNGGVFHSADSGATWQRSGALPDRSGGSFQTLAAGPDAAYLGLLGDPDGPGLYRSLDLGATWEPAVNGLHGLAVTRVAVDPADAATIYAVVASTRLFKTADGGATWTRLGLGQAGGVQPSIADLLIDPARPSTLWLAMGVGPSVLRSDDGGETWQPPGYPNDDPSLPPIRALALDPRAPGALWGAAWNAVLHSADGGATWESQPLDSGGVFVLFDDVEVDPRDPAVVWVSGSAVAGIRPPRYVPAVFRSADGGVTWERRDTGIQGGGVPEIALDRTDPQTDPTTLYAVTAQLFRSTDAGASWTLAPGLAGFPYVTVATSPAGPRTPATVFTARQLPAPSVLASSDHGLTWTPLRRGLAPAVPRVLEVDPHDPAHLLLGTENESLLSYTLEGTRP